MIRKEKIELELNEILTILFRTLICFILLIVSMKIMGKREIGQLSLFDFLIILIIADVIIIGIENYKQSVFIFLVPLIILVFSQKIIAVIDLKIPKIRKAFDGKEELIIIQGKLNLNAMKKEKYNMSDLYTQLREKSIRSIDEVEYAILETNGNLSVFTFDENKNVFPLPIIVSGEIEKDNLKYIKKTQKWVIEELYKQGINNINDVYGASYIDNKLKIVKKDKSF